MASDMTLLRVTSSAFEQNQRIPVKHTGDDVDISPAIAWSGAPAGTKEFALIMDDPDAPRPEPWVHWLIYKIPAETARLEQNIPTDSKLNDPTGALQGANSWDKYGYGGPLPPKGHGVHHYHFKVYALDAPLDVKPGLSKDELLKAMEGHVIGRGELIGTYER